MKGIHLVIFCKGEYKDTFLNHCVYSIEKYVQDKIVSKTVITDTEFKFKDFKTILDKELWTLIDPSYSYKSLYKDTWTRQQILKLSLDSILEGNILIVDADLIFLQKVKFVNKDKTYNFYTSCEFDKNYFSLISYLVDVNKQISNSFITDFGIFNSALLKEIKEKIKEKHHKSWLELLDEILPDSIKARSSGIGFLLSEYELYGNYVMYHHANLIGNIIDTNSRQSWIDFKSPFQYSSLNLIRILRRQTNKSFQSIRLLQNQ